MMYQIYFYVPPSHVDLVKNALFKAGAGTLGQYSCCAWQTLGSGQFYPEAGSNPFIGKPKSLETVEEYKVEMVCDETALDAAIEALKTSHPYETPAYGAIKLHDI